MNAESPQVKVVLVPVDFSDVTSGVLETAGMYARALGSRVVLMHVVEPDVPLIAYEPGPLPVMQPNPVPRQEARQKQMAQVRDQLAGTGLEVEAEVFDGHIVQKVIEQAKSHQADLIIMGSHGHGAVYNLLVGSVATGVLRDAMCPVLIVPAEHH